MIPEWSPKALVAKPVFYREWNDIDIYIEDTGALSKKIVREIVSRCLAGKFRVSEVFPLGGKRAVVEACSDGGTEESFPKVFIIDGDLDLMLKRSLPALKGLYALPVYCIENLLIDPKAIVEFMYEEDVRSNRDELEKTLAFEEWLLDLGGLLGLFVMYSMVHERNANIETVQYKVHRLLSSDGETLDMSAIENRKIGLMAELAMNFPKEDWNTRAYQMEKSLVERGINNIRIVVSGKDYLLPLLILRLRRLIRGRWSNESLVIRLAMKCATDALKPLCVFCEDLVGSSRKTTGPVTETV
jgi:hypothetical protein